MSSTKFSNRPVAEQSHEEHVAAGRKGGLARQHGSDDNMGESPAKRARSLQSQSGSKKTGSSARSSRGDDYDPESDKYGNEDYDDGIAMHTRSHDHNDGDDQHDDDSSNNNNNSRKSGGQQQKSSNGRSSASSGGNGNSNSKANAHTDFQSGKNPNRQAVSKALAQSRGHEAFVEMGRKGGKSNAGIHADVDYDDMESYKSNPEEGVPAKNPNRVRGGKQAAETRGHDSMSEMGKQGGRSNAGVPKFGGQVDMGEDDSQSFNQKDAKNPNRVAGGLRGAAKQSHESFVERGQKGGQSNAQKNSGSNNNNRNNNSNNYNNNDDDNDDDNENDYDGENDEGKNPNRVAGGKKAAETRARNGTQSHSGSRPQSQSGNNNGSNNNNRSQSRNNNNNNNDDENSMEDDDDNNDYDGENDEGKNPNRVAGGKKAAETRARNGTQSHSGSRPQSQSGNNSGNNNNNRGRQSGGQYQSQSRNNNDDDQDMDDDNDNDYDGENDEGKNPNRVAGGKKAAETRARNGTQSHSGSRPQSQSGNNNNNRSQSRNNNSNNDNNDDDDDDEDNFDNYPTDDFEAGDDAGGKNPNRVAGGKKAASHFSHEELSERAQRAAETRARNGTQSHSGSRPKNENYDFDNNNNNDNSMEDDDDNDNDDNDSGDNNEGKNPNRVEGGKKAAQTRAERGTQSHTGSRGGNDKNGGNYLSKGNNSNNNNSNNNNRQGQQQQQRKSNSGSY